MNGYRVTLSKLITNSRYRKCRPIGTPHLRGAGYLQMIYGDVNVERAAISHYFNSVVIRGQMLYSKRGDNFL